MRVRQILFFSLFWIFSANARAESLRIEATEIEARLTLCANSPQHFFACTLLLNQVLATLNPQLVLVTKDQWQPLAVAPLADFGDFKVIRMDQLPPTPFTTDFHSKIKLYPQQAPTDFLQVLELARKQGFSKLEESSAANAVYVSILSAWMRGFDLHASVMLTRRPASPIKKDPQPSVLSFNKDDKNFVYLYPGHFADSEGCARARQELAAISKVDGVILDLRNNPGGLVEQAVCWAELFLPVGTEVFRTLPIKKEGNSSRAITQASPLLSQPIVILQNSQTKSVAEVLAATLQAQRGAWLLGNKTYGKWTKQEGRLKLGVNEMPTANETKYGDQVRTFETTHFFALPSGESYQALGVPPDFELFEQPSQKVESNTVRESSFVPLALHSPALPQKKPRDEETIHRIERCVHTRALKQEYSDYQLLFASNWLACTLSH